MVVKLGTVSLDGTKIIANASKHKVLSWEHANRLEAQLKGAVEELMRLAEQADEQSNSTSRWNWSDANSARAQARFEAEQADYERKLAERAARAQRSGRNPGGKPSQAPEPGP